MDSESKNRISVAKVRDRKVNAVIMENKKIHLYFDKFLFPVDYETVRQFITDELNRLAKETGCSLAGLKIEFKDNGTDDAVAYFSHRGDTPIGFCFHLNMLDRSSPNKIIDTVRHEFAHYVVCVHYKGRQPSQAHGKEWMAICDRLGALPLPYMVTDKTKHIK